VVFVVVFMAVSVRLSGGSVVAFEKVLVMLVTIAVMLPISSRRTIPGGPSRVVGGAPSPSCVVLAVLALVDVGEVDKVLLVVRGGIVLLNPGPSGVEIRVVEVLVAVVGRPVELEGMIELEDGRMDEGLLGRMLELGIGVAELEAGLVEEVDVLVVVLKHSVTVLVTVSNGQLVTVTVARGQVVITVGGQAAHRAVASSQMAVEGGCVCVMVVNGGGMVAGGPRED
jgi:hypothetical protein